MAREVKLILDLDTGRIKRDSRKASRSVDQIDDSIQRTKKSTGALQGAWKKFGGVVGALAVGEVIRRGFTKAIQEGQRFEQQLADLSAITGISGDALDSLGETALETSSEYGVSASEIVEAQKLVASQLAEKIDFNTADGLEQLKEIANQATILKQASGEDLNTAVRAVSGTINQFGLEAEESARVINVLSASAKEGASELGQQVEAFRDAGTASAGANISLEETSTLIQRLAKNNIEGARAGTALRSVITTLQTETEKFAEAGVEVNLQQDGLFETLRKIQPVMSDTQKRTEIFGREFQLMANIVSQNVDELESFNERITDTNTAQEQAETQMATFQGATKRFSETLNNELIKAFQETDGAMVNIIETGTDFIEMLGGATRGINDYVQQRSRLDRLVGETTLFDYPTPDEFKSAEEFIELMDQYERQLEAQGTNIRLTAEEYAKTREEVDKGTEAWERYTRLIDGNAQELQSLITTGKESLSSLQNQRETTEEGTTEYAKLQERILLTKGALEQYRQELNRVNKLNEETETTDPTAGGGGQDQTQNLKTRMEELQQEKNTLILQEGQLTTKQKQRLQDLQQEINKNKRIIEQRQQLAGGGQEQTAQPTDLTSRNKQLQEEKETLISQEQRLTLEQQKRLANITKEIERNKQLMQTREMQAQGIERVEAIQVQNLTTQEDINQAIAKGEITAEDYVQTRTQGSKDIQKGLTAEEKMTLQVASAGIEAGTSALIRGENTTQAIGQIITAIIAETVALQIRQATATFPPPLNIALAGAFAGAIKALMNSIIPEFEDGGYIGGQTRGGGPIRGGRQLIQVNESGQSEYIINADSTRKAPKTIEAINESAGFAQQIESEIFSRNTRSETGGDLPAPREGNEGVAEAVRAGLEGARIVAPVTISDLDSSLEDFRETEALIGNRTGG